MLSVRDYFEHHMLLLNPKIRSAATIELYKVDLALLQQYFEKHYPNKPEVARPVLLSDLTATLVAGTHAGGAGATPAVCIL